MMEGLPLLVCGLALLLLGAEALVRGAAGLALRLRLSPAVVGLTVVAIGTSLPELVIGVKASLENDPEIAVGAVVGSNFFNLGAILGLSALIYPVAVESRTLRLEYPVMLIATLATFWLCKDGLLDRGEALGLSVAAIVFLFYLVIVVRTNLTLDPTPDAELVNRSSDEVPMPGALISVLVLAGCAMLHFGGEWTRTGAIHIAESWGWEQRLIGLTIVAFGTSAPELAVCVVAALRKNTDIAIGNIIGSCIFNLLIVLGVSGSINAMPVPQSSLDFDFWWLSGLTVGFFPLLYIGRRLGRWDGVVLVATFVVYYTLLLRR